MINNLSISQLESLLPSFFPEFQALTKRKLDAIPSSFYGVPCSLLSYISTVGFSKLI